MQVFSKDWFIKYQRPLLWLANNRLGRRLLRIHSNRSSVGKNKITKILPNAIFWSEGREQKAEFRTHDKFAKRLYYGLKPLWFVLHGWDFVFGNVAKQLDFGFLTLTAFPAAGAVSPVDGFVSRVVATPGEVLATIRTGAGTNFDNTTDPMIFAALQTGGTANQFIILRRGIFCFDTSSLGANAVISATTLSLFGTTKANDPNATLALHIVAATPAATDTLAASDYGNTGATTFGNVTFASYSTVAYNDITLNASGITNVSLAGTSKFTGRVADDLNNSYTGDAGTNSEERFTGNAADAAGTTTDPKLVVTYTVGGSAGASFLLNMV